MSIHGRPQPIAAHADQDRQFAQAFALLDQAIAERAFPGAALAVTFRGHLIAYKAVGHFTYEADSPCVQPECLFDLASLTKVAATTTLGMILHERGQLELEMPLVQVVPEFHDLAKDDRRRAQITIKMLLAHSAGLPAYLPLYSAANTHEQMVRAAAAVPLQTEPGTHAEYTDIGFILLGVALQRIAEDSLDHLCQREVFGPVGMTATGFLPLPALHPLIPPTEQKSAHRGRLIQGEVQDENAAAMGGVAGHAGLYAPALDLALFAECMLRGGTPILRTETVALFTRRADSPAGSRALGWDTPSSPSQSGRYFSQSSFGHLGYTGTSLWIDPERELSVILLSNRTWPDCSSQLIKQVRPAVHDAVIEAI